jgi:hypothetical protein
MTFNFLDFLSQIFIITFVVIMLMMLIEFINVKTRGQLLVLLEKYPKTQIWIGALLGLIPGCIGILAVVSLYTHHLITFGVLLAAAITSFGDEAFFMISLIPKHTLILVIVLFGMAIIAGYVADWILRNKKPIQAVDDNDAFKIHQDDVCTTHTHKESKLIFGKISLHRLLVIVAVGAFIVSILTGYLSHNHIITDSFSIHTHTQPCDVNPNATDDKPLCHPLEPAHAHTHMHTDDKHTPFSGENLIFLIVATFTLTLLVTVNNHFFEEHIWDHVIVKHFLKIFIWVFAITLFIKVIGVFVDVDILFCQTWGKMILLLFALLIALLPESGPNLVVLFLFMDGVIPFSTLIANSILQEGHGGLLLIAERPKDFFKLKLIKFILALLVGVLGLYLGF